MAFSPNKTTERFDRNIFDGSGIEQEFYAAWPTELKFYFAVKTPVGTLHGKFTAKTYYNFQRDNWLPIEIFVDDHSYCGWLDLNDVN